MPAHDPDLLARIQSAEQEINRLREFRHNYATDKMALLLKVEAMDVKLAQIRADFADSRTSHAQLANDVAALHHDLGEHQRAYELKIAEYDKERGLASKIAWPVIIALATAAALAIAGLLFRMYYLLK